MRLTLGGTGLRVVRRRLARWPMGSEWIERPRSSILGRKVCDRPIDVAGSQEFRSVIPDSIRAPSVDSTSVLVISIDLSPAGSVLATGSGDWQARICKFRYSLKFALALIR
jgi:hypothetical protein